MSSETEKDSFYKVLCDELDAQTQPKTHTKTRELTKTRAPTNPPTKLKGIRPLWRSH